MQTPPTNIQLLAKKFLQGTISADELQELNAWYEQQLPPEIGWETATDTEEILRGRMFGEIQKNGVMADAKVLPMHRSQTWNWAAASLFVVVAGFAGYYLQPGPVKQQPLAAVAKTALPDIQPGGNKAMLTLADGSDIVLDQSANGTLAQQGNTTVSKLNDGQLVYQSPTNEAPATPNVNILRTPKGGQYKLQLPDGSLVWLNAESSLKFPASFPGRERTVQLTGEAYFEIAKDRQRPFRVELAGQSVIEVMGTHFNVMAYQNENSIQATLLEGAVKVSHLEKAEILKPGEQAVINNEIHVSAVNVDEAIAWHKGDFQFSNSDMAGILRQLERWYGVNFVYEKLPVKQLNGSISRTYHLSQVLKMLEVTSEVTFKRENNTIRVLN